MDYEALYEQICDVCPNLTLGNQEEILGILKNYAFSEQTRLQREAEDRKNHIKKIKEIIMAEFDKLIVENELLRAQESRCKHERQMLNGKYVCTLSNISRDGPCPIKCERRIDGNKVD